MDSILGERSRILGAVRADAADMAAAAGLRSPARGSKPADAASRTTTPRSGGTRRKSAVGIALENIAEAKVDRKEKEAGGAVCDRLPRALGGYSHVCETDFEQMKDPVSKFSFFF